MVKGNTVCMRLCYPSIYLLQLWMDQYFARMASVRASGDMPSRIRFMLQDVEDMRENKWEPRRVAKEMTPKTIGQIRKEFPHTRVRTLSTDVDSLISCL